MARPSRGFLRVPFFLLLGAPLFPIQSGRAQSTWDRYKPGTLAAIMQEHDSTIRSAWVSKNPSYHYSGDQYPTVARVIYLGDSRPIDSTRREIVREWGLTFRRDSSIAGDFHREYLFQEGRQLLWLPVQDTVASFFARELKPGQRVSLYVMWLGAYYAGRDIIWVFIVNEFEAGPTGSQGRHQPGAAQWH